MSPKLCPRDEKVFFIFLEPASSDSWRICTNPLSQGEKHARHARHARAFIRGWIDVLRGREADVEGARGRAHNFRPHPHAQVAWINPMSRSTWNLFCESHLGGEEEGSHARSVQRPLDRVIEACNEGWRGDSTVGLRGAQPKLRESRLLRQSPIMGNREIRGNPLWLAPLEYVEGTACPGRAAFFGELRRARNSITHV